MFLQRLYTSSLINTLGSWLTFLAIALITQERYGTQYVALVFLVQTLPAIVLSRGFARIVPRQRQAQAYLVTQIILALNSLLLVFFQTLPVIFVHLLVASALRSLASSLFNSLLVDWVAPERQREVLTRLGGLQAGTLAFAPILGAWLKVMTSAHMLFLLDALTFVAGVALLNELFVRPTQEARWEFAWRDLFGEILPTPRGIPAAVVRVLAVWFGFLVVGALLNAIEFPGFEVHRLTEPQIGYALGAWGAGSLLAFLLPLPNLNPILSAALYVAGLLLFVVGGVWWVVIAAFFIAGAFSAYFSGTIRARLQASVKPEDNPAVLWAYANQVTQIINLVAYASAGLLLTSLGFHLFGAIMLLLGLGVILLVGVAK